MMAAVAEGEGVVVLSSDVKAIRIVEPAGIPISSHELQ
jgi:hypothetical protein